jgi:AcrR family transcriptional regulator
MAASTNVRRGAGRPRSAETELAILDATLAILVEEGFGGMSIESVAARAGVGKAAIYRRWSSKEQVVIEALRGHVASSLPMLDTGDLRADLAGMLHGIRRAMAGEDGPIMTAFVAEKARYPELRAEYERVFVKERRAHLQHIISAAVERGELPDTTDIELMAEAGPAILSHRLMVHDHALPKDLPDRIIELLLGPSTQPGHAPRAS